MPDQAEIFLVQAELAQGRSPLYARLWRELAGDARVAAIVGPSPAWDAPLRLMAGIHYLVLVGAATWEGVEDVLLDDEAFLRDWVSARAVQTNEVQRCWALLPCFLEAIRRTGARELDLVELGPSAGINLVWDRYGYSYESGTWGAPSPELRLAGKEHRRVPTALLELQPRVRSRTGIDRSPIDVRSDDGALLLKSFVWADQTERLRRLDAAIEAVRADPPDLVQGDIVERLPGMLESLEESDALTLVWETAVLGYVPEEGRRRIYETVARFGREHPLAFVQTSHPSSGVMTHYGLTLQLPPGAVREEVAFATHHGDWLDWLAGE
jgi:hypothetical protein